MRTWRLAPGGNRSWTHIGVAVLGLVGAGMVACSDLGNESGSGSAWAPEAIGQTGQAITNSQWVPSGYTCRWNDEFGGDFGGNQANSYIDQTKWNFENIYVNNELENYTNRECANSAHASDWNYCVSNGELTIQARNNTIDCRQTGSADCAPMYDTAANRIYGVNTKTYTSGRLMSKNKIAHEYGYIEFKARLPFQNGTRQSGLWPALWFLGANIKEGPPPAGNTDWPWAPEFDLMEWQSQGAHTIVLNGINHPQPAGMMASNAIFIGSDGSMDACNVWPETGSTECFNENSAQTLYKFDNVAPNNTNTRTGIFKVNDWSAGGSGTPSNGFLGWHTYGLLWTSTRMTAYIDGVQQGYLNTNAGANEFNENMFILMNLAVGGDLGGAVQVTDWTQAKLEVDYMRWYQSGGTDTCSGGGTTTSTTSTTATGSGGAGGSSGSSTSSTGGRGGSGGSTTSTTGGSGGSTTTTGSGGSGGGTCAAAYAQANWASYNVGTQVSNATHNWTCNNANCRNCGSDARCGPGTGPGCPWGDGNWTDNGTCH